MFCYIMTRNKINIIIVKAQWTHEYRLITENIAVKFYKTWNGA
jgi:hypothetical protein